MSDHVNYYDILNIPHGSNIDEVQKGFKILAKKWHPDRNKNNKEEAEAKYKEITEAYSILTDEKKKQIYDSHGIEGLRGGVGESVDAEQVFQMMGQMGGLGGMLNNMMGGMMGNMMGNNNSDIGVPNIQMPLEVSLEDAFIGKTMKVKVKRIDVCSKCEGSGAKEKNQDLTCTVCNGNSPMTARMGMGGCGTCRNSGINPNIEKCKKCNGRKGIETEVEVSVKVPRGVFNKTKIVLEGEGHQIPPNKLPRNDLTNDRTDIEFIIISPVDSHDGKFNRGVELIENILDPADMHTRIDVSFVDSVCGFVHELEHVDGHMIKVVVPNSCRHLDTFVIKGEGMPRLGKNKIVIKKGKNYAEPKNLEFGNLVIQINVEHPNDMQLDTDTKTKLIKLLGGKQFKLPKDVPTSITLEQYRKDYEIKYNTDKMKAKYSKKNKKTNDNNSNSESSDDSDDSSDGDYEEFQQFGSFNGMPGMTGGRVQVQECNPS